MGIDYNSFFKAVEIVLKNHEGRNTVTSSLTCGVITGISSLVGLPFGPLGFYAGALIGSSIAYATHRNKFKSLLEVIQDDMSVEERNELMTHIEKVLKKFNITDAIMLIQLAQGNPRFQQELFHILRCFIQDLQEQKSNANRQG